MAAVPERDAGVASFGGAFDVWILAVLLVFYMGILRLFEIGVECNVAEIAVRRLRARVLELSIETSGANELVGEYDVYRDDKKAGLPLILYADGTYRNSKGKKHAAYTWELEGERLVTNGQFGASILRPTDGEDTFIGTDGKHRIRLVRRRSE